MSRVKLKKNLQVRFLADVKQKTTTDWPKLAMVLDVHPRCLSDWRRGKFTMPEEIFNQCLRLTKGKIKTPAHKILPDFWSARKFAKRGGLVRAQKYGSPGTPKGRRQGGLTSQKRRKLHPELFRHCNLKKDILKPRNSSELAELFGIILGDGGINSDHQVVITLNKENDKKYIQFVSKLIRKIFGLLPAIYKYRSPTCKKVVGVTINSTAVVEFLLRKGLKKGSKVRHQIDAPDWIKNNIEFSKSCLRGLIDTDGGVYYHRHNSHGYRHFNIGLCFTNMSLPLLNFVENTLSFLRFNPKLSSNKTNIYLYRKLEVLNYIQEIGFSNPYHLKRVKGFLENKDTRKGARVV